MSRNIPKSDEIDLKSWVGNPAITDNSNSGLSNGDITFDAGKNFEAQKRQDAAFQKAFSRFSTRKVDPNS